MLFAEELKTGGIENLDCYPLSEMKSYHIISDTEHEKLLSLQECLAKAERTKKSALSSAKWRYTSYNTEVKQVIIDDLAAYQRMVEEASSEYLVTVMNVNMDLRQFGADLLTSL